jgi:hypothetical protein
MKKGIWAMVVIGAALMASGLAALASAGSMNGDCDQTQDQLRLKDGTGDNCTCTPVLASEVSGDNTTCDSCKDYDWNFLYGETDQAPPHKSACGQSDAGILSEDSTDDSSGQVRTMHTHMWCFIYSESDTEAPHMSCCGTII